VKIQDHYDWIVIGNHPAALLTSSLVSRLGLAVLVLPVTFGEDLFISQSGHYFDPEPNFLLGLGRAGKYDGLISQCFEKLGLQSAEQQLIEMDHSGVQVLTPKVRLDLNSTEAFQHDLQREFGKSLSKSLGLIGALKQTETEYLSFWQNLPKRMTLTPQPNRKPTPSDPKTLKQLQSKLLKGVKSNDQAILHWFLKGYRVSDLVELLKDEDLRETLTGIWNGTTQAYDSDPPLFDLLHMLSLARTGAAFKGGMTAYREFLLSLAKRHGAHILPDAECKRIFVEKGKFVGVQIVSRGSMVSAKAGIIGCLLNRVHNRVVYNKTPWFRKMKKSPSALGWRFTLSLTVHQEAIPPGLLKRAIWQEKGAPTLEIEVVNPEVLSSSSTQSDQRVLFIRTLMPLTQESLSIDYQRLVAARMLRQANDLLPFLEFHVTRIYPDFRKTSENKNPFGVDSTQDQNHESELKKVYGFKTLDEIPDNLVVTSGKGLSSHSGVDGLFVASSESYPDLGSFGPTVAALEGVAEVAHRSGIAGPLT
jgi:hypothetical protein